MLGFGLAIEPQLWTLIFTMVRVGAAFIAAPVFGAVAVPVQVRILLSAAIGILAMNVAPITPPAEIFALTTFLSIAAEALVGLSLGFILQIAFAAPFVASEVIGSSMGIGFAAMVDPQNGTATPALGTFLSVLMILLFLSVDGHLVLVELVVDSYTLLPPGQAWLGAEKLRDIAFFGGYAFMAGLLLALPVGFLLLCLNLVVGMLSRSTPSLNLFAVGLPASLLVGVVSLFVAMPAMGDYMLVIVAEALSALRSLVLG
ncbi:flagellar biosynthetic protein FliR [Sphingomonas japonica]|uniref:Flagellar biosynthetic protein FliR n=1 Tax=Sphingomonas japonica TaxID=511662 RepID=A0ABX0TZS9_9SPHN|nr:flagellar biosynthetic protein FliR [Sphingomonas japonica]NIJ23820.1 flagellar biosynthetic protein FliR [Sphingomonas japonica]